MDRRFCLAASLFACAFLPALAPAGVITFSDQSGGEQGGGLSDPNLDDLVTSADDGIVWGIRSTDGGEQNDTTFVLTYGDGDSRSIRANNWSGKTYFRPTANSDADAGNDVVFDATSMRVRRVWGGDDDDFTITGYKSDSTTVTDTYQIPLPTSSTAWFTYAFPATFTGLTQVRLDVAGGVGNAYVTMDSIAYSVPEPSGVLPLAGALLLAARRRRSAQ